MSSAGGGDSVSTPPAVDGGVRAVEGAVSGSGNGEGAPSSVAFDAAAREGAADAEGGRAGNDTGQFDGGQFDGGQFGRGAAPALGSLDVTWMHGAARCAQSTDPEIQIHAYDGETYIVRQDKCRTFEAPFVYLLLGEDRALLLDTGATNSTALRDTVLPLVGQRALFVAHSHSHGDHVAGDARFQGLPATTVVGTGVAAVQAAFGIEPWPVGSAELDLGGRVLDVVAIPGHQQAHIAIYDRNTELLFTGDSLYPGMLFIEDWATYRSSVRRLADFVASHRVSHVLGAHVEMTSTPGVSYPYGATFQPDEHVLELEAAHVLELDAALNALGPAAPTSPIAHADFVIVPR